MTSETPIRQQRRFPRLRVAACWAAFALVVGFAADLEAKSGNVRYSYEQVEVGSRAQWVLLPETESELKGEVSMETYRTAFELLREDKEKSYGNSSIEVSGSSPENAKVKVQIDSDKAKFKLIVMAETVYTMTELGAESVAFPGFSDEPMTRADVPFSAYTPTLPLWRALPRENFADARIRLPDGTVLGAEECLDRFEKGDEEIVEALFTYLDHDQSYVVRSVASRLPKLGVDYVDEVLPLLRHDSRRVRKTALEVLANHRDDERVLEKVVEFMESEEDDELANKAAQFLGESDRPRFAVDKQFFLLARGSAQERVRAAKALKEYRDDDRVVTHLADALRQKSKKVASSAATSLLELGAHDKLASALDSGGVAAEVKLKIARGLIEEEPASARVDGRIYLVEHAEGRESRESLRQLAKIGTEEAREAAESFLTSDNRQRRLVAVETVEKIGDTASLSALAEAARSLEKSQPLEDGGFAILRDRASEEILEYTGNSDSIVQRMAYRALGTKAADGDVSSKVFETLKEGANHSDAAIRGAAVRGLGKLADKRSLKILEKLADDPNATVRRGVAFALGNYKNGQMSEKLNAYLEDDSPEVKAAALASLAKRGDSSSWDQIEKLANSEHPEVRQRALEAIASLVDRSDDQAVRSAISMLSGKVTSEDNKAVLRTAIEQLGSFERKRAVNGIAIQLNSKDKSLRLATLEALGKTGHSRAVGLLEGPLSDPDPEIRRAAIEAYGELGLADGRPKLEARLKEEEDSELKKLIEKTLETL